MRVDARQVVSEGVNGPPGPAVAGTLDTVPAAGSGAGMRAVARAAIRRLIASGALRPGDRLTEAALSARIGVSRSPIREALRELEQQGLVVSYPNRGSFVVDLDDEDAEEVILLRGWLEGLAARLASDRMSRLDFRQLEDYVQAMAAGDPAHPQALVEADAAFHTAVVRLSGHRRLYAIWQGIDPLVWLMRIRRDRRTPDEAESIAAEHREVIAALREGPDAAEAAARYHVVRGLDRPPRAWAADQTARSG
jgi:DNA-binding GntR family transcriptional regulator